MVDVKYKSALVRFVSLSELKSIHMKHVKDGGPLQNMALFTRARLSVQPVSQGEHRLYVGACIYIHKHFAAFIYLYDCV